MEYSFWHFQSQLQCNRMKFIAIEPKCAKGSEQTTKPHTMFRSFYCSVECVYVCGCVSEIVYMLIRRCAKATRTMEIMCSFKNERIQIK